MGNLKLFKSAVIAISFAIPLCGVSQVTNDNEDNVFRVEQQSQKEFVPGEVLVKFKDSSPVLVGRSNGRLKSVSNSKVEQLLKQYGVKDMEKVFPNEKPKAANLRRKAKAPNGQIMIENNLDQIYRIKLEDAENESNLKKLVADLETLDEVAWAEPNYVVYMTGATQTGTSFDSPMGATV